MADFYRSEQQQNFHPANLIHSRKLYIDQDDDANAELESYDDQLAMESEIFETSILSNEIETVKGSVDEDLQVLNDYHSLDDLNDIDDQLAMESLDRHFKKITQLPLGLKNQVESDLIRKLTTVSPTPRSKKEKTEQSDIKI